MAEATPSATTVSGSWRHRLRRLATAALDLALPPRCLGCGEGVPVQGELCPACWSTIRFLHAPWCDRCGTPLPFEDPRVATCGTCRAHPPPFDRARAAVAYDPASARLVIGFKRRDRIEAAATFAAWMRNAGRELLSEADLLVPVPLHRWRLWQRGYNQSCLLAKRLHDRGRSGWWAGVLLIALIGFWIKPQGLFSFLFVIIMIWTVIELGLIAGEQGANRFGPSPLRHAAA